MALIEVSLAEETLSAVTDTRGANEFRLHRWMPLVVFAASMLTTCLFLAVLPERFGRNDSSDYAAQYEPVAQSILAGRGIVLPNGEFATTYPPGYSVILAGVFGLSRSVGLSEGFGVAALSITSMALVTALMFSLARTFWGMRAAFVAAALWMTYPFALWITKQPNTELPFMVLLYGGIGLFALALLRRLSWQAYFVVGLMLGMAMLVRSIAIGLPFVACAVVCFAPTRINASGRALIIVALLGGSLVAVLPWETRVYAKTGRIVPLGTNGVRSIRDGLTYSTITKGYRTHGAVPSDVVDLTQRIFDQSSPDSTFSELASVVAQQAVSNPSTAGKLIATKIARSWYGTDSGRGERAILIIQFLYLTLIAWSIRRIWSAGATHRLLVMSAVLITLYFWGMTVLGLSIFRYMLPVMPLLFVLVGAAVASRAVTARKATAALA
jgi:hypothetical protein